MDALTLLRGARERLARPGGWVANKRGVNAQGRPTDGDSPDAIAWCALGALDAARGNIIWGLEYEDPVIQSLADEVPADFVFVHSWNDGAHYRLAQYSNTAGQQATVALFDRVIAKQEKLHG